MTAALQSRLVWFWVVFIVLSQTDSAGNIANGLFDVLFGWLFEPHRGGDETLHFVLQKGYHVFLFGVFGWLLAMPNGRRGLGLSLAACVVVGAASEALQLLSSSRSPQVADAVLNVVAGCAAVWLSRAARSRERRVAATSR